ncbi:hypothetical protein PG913_07600 [Tenacibaculum pacificus]|uniref:hypothetical protein n=1 Tax=Tenacibaculum pacificus TaxID=3018314 RepID=UPI0022F3EF6B|nr:hypothetical protein [Tenacibaculum pacificus]WBX72774.1 hypothetical protein PG913_07600 [Tenacibaculum pacificus]
MKQIYTDETFLARWVANDLSATELKEFQNSDVFHEFNKINEASQFLTVPDYDKSGVFNKITAKLQKEKNQKL